MNYVGLACEVMREDYTCHSRKDCGLIGGRVYHGNMEESYRQQKKMHEVHMPFNGWKLKPTIRGMIE